EGDLFNGRRKSSSSLQDIASTKCKRKRNARVTRGRKFQAIPQRNIVASTHNQRRRARRICFEGRYCAGAGASTERASLRKQLAARQTSVCARGWRLVAATPFWDDRLSAVFQRPGESAKPCAPALCFRRYALPRLRGSAQVRRDRTDRRY